jgi:RHS repeat-associated protein
VATYRDSDSNPKEQFIFHNAGANGVGGSSYIDSVVLRDKDANVAWNAAADGTLEQRRYYNQNWRADVISMLTSTGQQVEGSRFHAYGIAFGANSGDMDFNGIVDSNDTTAMQTIITAGGYDIRGDMDRDNDLDLTDKSRATTNIGTNLGFGLLSVSSNFNRTGYAGYQFDPISAWSQYHVRHRWLNSDLGRWISRDPLGHIDGSHLSNYVSADPIKSTDALGLSPGLCGGIGCLGIAFMQEHIPLPFPTPYCVGKKCSVKMYTLQVEVLSLLTWGSCPANLNPLKSVCATIVAEEEFYWTLEMFITSDDTRVCKKKSFPLFSDYPAVYCDTCTKSCNCADTDPGITWEYGPATDDIVYCELNGCHAIMATLTTTNATSYANGTCKKKYEIGDTSMPPITPAEEWLMPEFFP